MATGRLITGELNNGTVVSEIEFTNNGTHLISLPSGQSETNGLDEYHENVASVWPISISQGKQGGGNLPKIITAIGGLELNERGITVEDDSLKQLRKYEYLKNHFFDNVDFSDARINYTPLYHNKLERYFKSVVYPMPDSIMKDVDIAIISIT